MNRPMLATLTAATLLALAATRGPARAALPFEAPTQKTLANGLRVVVFPRPGAGFVQVQLVVPAGTAAEGAGQRGAAPLVAQMLRLGTSSRSAETFAEDVARLGGSFASTSQRENAVVGAAFLPRDLEGGLELISDAVINPIFDDEAFERTRTQAVRELVRLHADPAGTGEEQLWSFALPDVPAAREPLGDLTSLFSLTRESMRAFHRDHYRPDHAVLAIAGDVTPARAFELAGQWFSRWSGQSTAAAAAAPAPRAGTRVLLVDRPEWSGASVRMGWRVPGRDAADDLARSLAMSLAIDALDPRSVKLPAEAGLGANLGQLRNAGLLDVRFNVPGDSVGVAIARVRRALRRLRDAAPDPARVAVLTRQVANTYPLRFATAGGAISQWLIADASGGDPAVALATYPGRVAALDGAALFAALKREWDPDRVAIVVIGSAEKLRAPLARIGTVTEVRLDLPPIVDAAAGDSAAAAAGPTVADEKAGREKITKAVAAHGGLAALRGIQDVVSEARVRLDLQGRELRGELRQMRKEPLRMVYLTSFDTFESRQVLNGDHAWSVTSEGQLQNTDSIGVRALQSGFTSDVPHLLLSASDPTTQVTDLGTARVGGVDAWEVEILPVGGQRRRLYIDPATARLVAMDQNEEGGRTSRLAARRLYRDLRPVGGILVPFEEERQIEGKTVMNVYVTRFQINVGLGDDEFQRPSSMPVAPGRK